MYIDNCRFKDVSFAKITVTTVTRAQRSVPSWALVYQWAAVYETLIVDRIMPTDGKIRSAGSMLCEVIEGTLLASTVCQRTV